MSKNVKLFVQLKEVKKSKDGKSIPIYRINRVDSNVQAKKQSEIKRVTL